MIILIRHATPNVDYSPCDFNRARELTAEYDITTDVAVEEIEAYFQTKSFNMLKEIEIEKVFCSPLPRARATCQAVLPGYLPCVNQNFVEAHTEIGKIPFISLKLRHWFLINRIRWLMNMSSPRIEGKEAFIDRVYKAFLDIQSVKGNVAVVAHGVFLKYLKDKWLTHNRYVVIDRYKNGCFTVEILKQVNEI